MNTITATKEYYKFYLEVTDPLSGETVHVEWDGLTLAEAKKMHSLTDKRYSRPSMVETFGWEVMR
jgi:hypothetical protein